MLGNPYYVSSKGRQILMERLTPKQGVKINRFELAEKFGLSPGQIYNHIQQVSDMYPASITRNGHDLITTSEIYEVLENTIKERVPPPDFQPVYLNNLIEGTTIGKKRFKSAINALRDQYPQHFFGGNNTVKPLYVSNEGEQLINSLIKGLTHPEHFVEFSFESFGDELNVDAYITNYYLDKLRKENPDEVTPKASGGIKVYISENGLTILKEMVQNRPRK